MDGELLATITENVPSKPGPWLFNSWSSVSELSTLMPELTSTSAGRAELECR